MRTIIATAAAVLLLAGCAAAPTPAAGPVEETTPTAPAEIAPTVETLSANLRASISTITDVVVLTEDNDPNDLLGRPTGYTGGAVIYDSGAACTELGADCGATLEEWPSQADAQGRADYIQGILKDSPMLGSEYDYVNGNFLLRVSGTLPPSVAAQYEAAFNG